MAHPYINKRFYDVLVHFEESEEAQDTYYRIMDSTVERNGRSYTVRDQILRAYAMLFCDNIGAQPGYRATLEDVEATADCLYIGEVRFDPKHWYRMLHHFPVIDEDNYDRFAALVIADLNAGPLHESAGSGDGMLLMGEPNPLTMTAEARRSQKLRTISVTTLSPEGDRA